MGNKLRCIIIDDEEIARGALVNYVSKINDFQLITSFSNGIDAKDWLQKNDVDLLFLDIQMPFINGLEFLRLFKKTPPVIFTTAYPEYALEGYEYNVIDYLVKPISLERFLQASNKALQLLGKKTSRHKENLILKEGTNVVKISLEGILFIEAMQNYVQIVTASKRHMILMTIKDILKLLPDDLFFRVHRSYVVNLDKVQKIAGDSIYINESTIPISKRNKNLFLEKFRNIL